MGREGGDIDLLLGCLGCSNAGFGSVQNDDVVGRVKRNDRHSTK